MPVRDRLLEIAERRFATDGVIDTRLRDIRTEAGVSVGAVYHHFPDKGELYAAAWLTALGAYQQAFATELAGHADARGGVEGIVVHHLRWVAAHRHRAILLGRARPAGASATAALRDQNRAFFDTVTGWWRTHAGYGAVRDLPLELVYALWLGPAQEYAHHWLAGRLRRVPADAAPVLAAAAWETLKGPDAT